MKIKSVLCVMWMKNKKMRRVIFRAVAPPCPGLEIYQSNRPDTLLSESGLLFCGLAAVIEILLFLSRQVPPGAMFEP